MEAAKLARKTAERVAAVRVVHVQPTTSEHRDLKPDRLDLLPRHPLEALKCAEAIHDRVHAEARTGGAQGGLRDAAPCVASTFGQFRTWIQGDGRGIQSIGFRPVIVIAQVFKRFGEAVGAGLVIR